MSPLTLLLLLVAAQPDAEGPLDNDVFLPVSRPATEALARGDAAYAERTEALRGELDRARLTAFEAWRSALTSSATGDSVSLPADAVDAARRTQGVEQAVLARLEQLGREEQSAWSQRFDELARSELERAGGSPSALALVERRNPATRAAVTACLRLADLELESGRPRLAVGWSARGRRHAELALRPRTDLEALAARANAAAELIAGESRNPVASFDTARELAPIGRIDLRPKAARSTRTNSGADATPTGPTPGLAFLEDGRIAVQTADRIVLVPPEARGSESSFEPGRLLPAELRTPPARAFPGGTRHWPLEPACAGGELLLVHGSATPFTDEPNALVCVRPPAAPAFGAAGPDLPALSWAVVGDRLVDGGGRVEAPALLADFSSAEFQPGPLILGTEAFVQVRQYLGEVRAWLVCFDLATGQPMWARLLAQGAGLAPTEFRSEAPLRASDPGQPLVQVGGSVFVGTHLGAGVLVDTLDGRVLWSFENRRRGTGERGWRTNAAPAVARVRDAAEVTERIVIFAPQDSDHVYWLRAGGAPGLESPLVRPPVAIGLSVAFLGGDADHAFVAAQDGARRVASSWSARDGARYDSPFLGRDERFGGGAAWSPERLAFASDRGVYLLDRRRELYLLDYAPLPSPPLAGSPGGSVRVRGRLLFVVGEDALWTFSIE